MNVGFGVTELWKDRETGVFFCPVCGNERHYIHRQSRTWIRIVVPLIPRDVLQDIYQCQTCHRPFDDHVLTSPPTSNLSTRLQRVARAASVLTMLNGDPHNGPARTKAVDVVRGIGMRHYSETDLDADLRSIDVSDLDRDAEALTVDLDASGRERLLVDVGHVAIASGELSHDNRAFLDELGRSLSLPPGVVHRVIAQLNQEAVSISAFAPSEEPTV